MASPVSRALTSTASSSGVGGRLGADRGRPAVQLAGAEAAGLGVPGPDHVGHLGVAGGPQPELVLEERPPAGLASGVAGHVVPHRGQLARGRVGDRHLGQQHGAHRVLPRVEEGQQQALLAAEVGVDRTGGPAGGLGHRVHRHRVDALVGEEVGGRGEQARSGLGLAFLLGLGHVPPVHGGAAAGPLAATVHISEALCKRWTAGVGRPASSRTAGPIRVRPAGETQCPDKTGP